MRREIIYVMMSVLLCHTTLFAQIQKEEINEETLKKAMKDAETEYANEVDEYETVTKHLAGTFKKSSSQMLEDLAQQVNSLKSKNVIEKAAILATQTARKVKVKGAKTVFNYKEDDLYEVHTGVDHVTDVHFEPDEEIVSAPVAGDTVRWSIASLKSGNNEGKKVEHLIIKPLEENLETNLIVPTSKRTYHLKLISSEVHMPSVSWNYPESTEQALKDSVRKDEEKSLLSLSPENLFFEYKIEGKESFKPKRVFDDGKKTYIQMPSGVSVREAPVLFAVDESSDDLIVINYRIVGDYLIADGLIDEGILRVGNDKEVRFFHKNIKKGFFSRIF